jgi:mRNA interferase YafQ
MMQCSIKFGKQYRKDIKRLLRSGYNLGPLEEVVEILVSGKNLPSRYRDHALKGRLTGSRECHISGDWLLRYVKDEEQLLLLLLSTGDHRHVLGIE